MHAPMLVMRTKAEMKEKIMNKTNSAISETHAEEFSENATNYITKMLVMCDVLHDYIMTGYEVFCPEVCVEAVEDEDDE